jgi:sugar lactone lactonase YvrE
MTSFLRACAACCATTLILTACSGGGGTSATPPTITDPLMPPPPPPVSLHAEAIAGTPSVPGDYADGTIATAMFLMPVDTRPTSHLAFDNAGNLYVADKNEVIRKITPAGAVKALAGSPGKPGTADGAGADATFNNVLGMAADASGNVYVGDSSSVRKITAAGVVTTLAGKAGAPGFHDGQGAQASFGAVTGGLAVDGEGNVYVADTSNNAIRRVSPSGNVQTLALAVQLSGPGSVAIDPDGNLAVAEPYRVLRFTPDGRLINLVDSSRAGWVVDGPPSQASFGYIQSIAFGHDGKLYLIDRDALTIAIRTMDENGAVTTLRPGSSVQGLIDGPIATARFGSAFAGNNGIAFDAAGNLFLADLGNNAIRKITPGLQVSTYAGKFRAPPVFADGTGAAAAFHGIVGFAKDKAGNYYVADAGNCAIRKITPEHVVTTLAGAGGKCGNVDGAGAAARFATMRAMTQDANGDLYVAEQATVRKVSLGGAVTTLAGAPGTTAKADGRGSSAAFVNLQGIAMGLDGNLLVTDGQQYGADRECTAVNPVSVYTTLRTITPQGMVTTVPGSEAPCGGEATPLARGGDLRFDAAGDLYLVSGTALGRRTAAGATSYVLDDKGQLVTVAPLGGHHQNTLAPDDAGNVFFVLGGEVYKYSQARGVTKAVGRTGAANAIEITPDLPVTNISALTYIGNHQFLASFDDQVVMLTLK